MASSGVGVTASIYVESSHLGFIGGATEPKLHRRPSHRRPRPPLECVPQDAVWQHGYANEQCVTFAGSGGPYQSEASSWGTTSSASGVPLILTATSDLKIAVELSNTSSVSESTKRLCSIAHAAHEPSTTFGVSVLFAGVSGRHVVVGVRHSMPASAGNQDPVHRHRDHEGNHQRRDQ